MSIVITFLVLFLTAITLLILRILTPTFRYTWLFAVGGALMAWISVFIWQTEMPITLNVTIWQPALLFSQSPTFIADGIAWAFALSLVTLCLSILITAVVRSQFPNPISWVGTLVLTSLGILAVVADNPLTLVLIWAAIDLVELATQVWFVEDTRLSERVAIAFASRTTGILILLWADVIGSSTGQALDFRAASPQAGLYLILAAGLRLGVLPLHLPYPSESALRRGFGTGLRMVSAASSLILLARIPAGSVNPLFTAILLMLVSLAGVYGGWMWLRAPDDLTGRPYWLIGMGSLAIAATLRSNPVGAAAWGCALILSGSALFLFSEPNKWLARALYVALLGISTFPFSVSALGWVNGGTGFWLAFPFLLAAHALLMAGFIRHVQRSSTRISNENQPIWGRNVFPMGIAVLLLTMIILGLFGWDGALRFGNWFMGSFAAFLAVGLLWLTPRLRILNPVRAHWVKPASDSWVNWGYRALWGLYRQMGRITNSFLNMLEGESGIMWTLLFLVLFITVFTQRTR